jgi:hypothetical protein
VAEPSTSAPQKLRDWPMFRAAARKGGRPHDGRAPPRIGDLIMSVVPGSPAEKLAWLLAQKAAGKLANDDPEDIAQAEALLVMLGRLSSSKGARERRHLDELLDEGLKQTFPASDPVSIGHFTGTEPPSKPIG